MKKDIIPISPELQAKIQVCDPDVQDFIGALQSELLKLHKHNLGLEAKNVSLNSRISVLEEEMKPFRQIREATDEELTEEIKEILSKAIKKKNGSGEG
jgi:hypothetical protein